MKLAVAGTGYVGLSIATLLAQHHEVMAVDIIEDKVNKINNRINPNQDEYIERYPKEKELNLTATLNANEAYKVVVFYLFHSDLYLRIFYCQLFLYNSNHSFIR